MLIDFVLTIFSPDTQQMLCGRVHKAQADEKAALALANAHFEEGCNAVILSLSQSARAEKREYKAQADEKAELALANEHFEEGCNAVILSLSQSARAEKREYKAQADEKAELALANEHFEEGCNAVIPLLSPRRKKNLGSSMGGWLTEVKFAGLGNRLFNNRQNN